MNTDWSIEHMLRAEPIDIAGPFATRFADGSAGESGRCWFGSVHHWAVAIAGGPTIFAAGDRSVVMSPGRDRTTGPRHSLPNRPPWSLVLPRLAPIFGRPTDDWRPVEINRADPTTLHLVSTDDPYLQDHAVIAPEAGIILELATPSWTATFTPDGAVRAPLRRRWHAEFEI